MALKILSFLKNVKIFSLFVLKCWNWKKTKLHWNFTFHLGAQNMQGRESAKGINKYSIPLFYSIMVVVIARETTTWAVPRELWVVMPMHHHLFSLFCGFLHLLQVLLSGCFSPFLSFLVNHWHPLHQLLFQVWSHLLNFHLCNVSQ